MRYGMIGGLRSSRVILGSDRFGEKLLQSDAFRLIDAFRDFGGNHIDTARIYGAGASEETLGAYFRERGKGDLILSSKGGHPDLAHMDISRLSRAELEQDLDESLKALSVDCIDLYFLHRDDVRLDAGEIVEILNSFVKAGKIRSFGASNWHAARIGEANAYAKAHGLAGFAATQIRMSVAHTAKGAATDPTLVEMDPAEAEGCRGLGIPVFAFSSQASGFFSLYEAKGAEALQNDHKRAVYYSEENLRKAESVSRIAQREVISPSAAVVAAMLSVKEPNVFPLVGARSPEMLADSLAGADTVLPADELRELFAGVLL